MKKNKDKKPKVKRKFIILTAYFIILPIIVIVALYTTTYFNNKIKPFKDKNAEYTTLSKIDSFDFDFYCTKYDKPTKGNTSTKMEFKAAITNKKINYEVSSVKYSVVMGSNWNGYLSSTSSQYSLSFPSTDDKVNYVTATISDYKLKYPDRVLLFINIKHPTAFVYLEWTEKKNGSKEEAVTKKYILEYSYDDYFIKDKTIM